MNDILRKIIQVGIKTEPPPTPNLEAVSDRLKAEVLRHFQGALAIRQVDAGSCNGCELEMHALSKTGLKITHKNSLSWLNNDWLLPNLTAMKLSAAIFGR